MWNHIKQLTADDLDLMNSLLDCFGEAFEELDTYGKNRPDASYMREFLGSKTFISLVAHINNNVVVGLAAYVLKKFEQKRSEVYIYDLAVNERLRRKGIASALINELKNIAKARGAWVVFVQADSANSASRQASLPFRLQLIRGD